MKDIVKRYTNGEVTVVWKPALCIHSALCVGGLVTARGVTDPALAQELRQAAYRQAQTMLKARPC